MTDARPDPLVPAEVDLRDFPSMLIDIARLFGSEFHAAANDGEWRAGVTLWLKSFHQVPGGSLPHDDVALCRLAELGRDLKMWKRVREQALHGWKVASDGRMYHKVVAEKVLEAWIEKLGQRKSSGAGNAKRWGVEFDEAAINAQIATAARMLAHLNPQSRLLQKKLVKDASGNPAGTANGAIGNPDGTEAASHRDKIPLGESSQGKGREGNNVEGKGTEPPLPSPSPIEKQESKNSSFRSGNGMGHGNGTNGVTIEDPLQRMARFQEKLTQHLGSSGHLIVLNAMDSKHPQHAQCLALCKEAARKLGKGWPRNWPIDP